MSTRKCQLIINSGATMLVMYMLLVNSSLNGINYGDSQDILLAASGSGLAHPPGYPLMVNLLRLLHYLLPFVSWGVIGTIISSGSLAIAAGVFSYILQQFMLPSKTLWQHRILYAWGIVLAWISVPHIWIFGLIPEIMSFTFMVSALFILCIFTKKSLLAGMVASLLVMFHVLTLGYVLPISIVFISAIKAPKRNFFIGIIIGIVITGLNYALLTQPTTYGWRPPGSLLQWWQFWNRSSYDASLSAVDMYRYDVQIGNVLKSIGYWGQWISGKVDWWLLGLASFGGYVLRYHRKLVRVLGVALILYSIGIIMYLKAPILYVQSEMALWYGTALRERMMYPLLLIILFFAASGLSQLVPLINHRLPQKYAAIAAVLFLGIGYFSFSRNIGAVGNIQSSNASLVFAQAVLDPLPQQSVLLVDSDEIFNLLYVQRIVGFRPDLNIVPVNIQITPEWYGQNELSQNGFQPDTIAFVSDVVSWNLYKNRRVFAYQFEDELLSYVGVEGNPFFAVPFAYTLEIVKTPPPSIGDFDYGVSAQLASHQGIKADNWFKYSQLSLSYLHTQLAYFSARIGASAIAAVHQELAQGLAYKQTTKDQIASIVHIGNEHYQTKGSYLSIPPQTAAWWLAAGESDYFSSRAKLLDPTLNTKH